jgi:thioredoxin:protein disulfide reductase
VLGLGLDHAPAAVAAARAAGRPLLVDFAASWCVPCHEFEVRVFSRPDVAAAMQHFTLLRVDVSREDEDPALGAIKRKYGADTLPAIRILSSNGEMVARTDTFVPAEQFLALLARAAP